MGFRNGNIPVLGPSDWDCLLLLSIPSVACSEAAAHRAFKFKHYATCSLVTELEPAAAV